MVSGVMNRNQTWAESAEEVLWFQKENSSSAAREELLSLRYLQHATSPERLQGWTCRDEALRCSGTGGRPRFTILSRPGRSLNQQQGHQRLAGRAVPRLGWARCGLRCPLVSRAAAGLPREPSVGRPASGGGRPQGQGGAGRQGGSAPHPRGPGGPGQGEARSGAPAEG